MTIDLHIDAPWQAYKRGIYYDLSTPLRGVQVDFPRMKKGGLDKFVAALYLSDKVQDEIGDAASWDRIVQQMGWFDDNEKFLLGLEGGRLLGGSIERIKELKDYRVVYITLTHNRNTTWADSATDKLTHNGLTAVGKRLVKEIEKAGILVDVSHTSEETILDVLTQASRPVIASHSGVLNLVNHSRNLSDYLIREIAATKGIIGIPYAKRFVKDTDGVVLAIDHIAQLLGTTEHIGIGSDLDGAETVIPDVADWSQVLAPLYDLGYTDTDLDGIKGGNFERILKES